ncbi:FRG domain-containing protein [Amantichitinum ursilacus]|uniref:FRG domain protein n=1 Tax=Amantichitinum ursilacus TaxID=857265 RepID=A0A0N1JSV6_9NEIS|nr:FRG domain-containing protein [Amantichitinum ursilacus]KPC53046.1 FRG domain protein [Amantichitinum ursilacus]
MQSEAVQCVPFKTARELFDYLSPLNENWSRETFIFRGQPDSTMSLIPASCREAFAKNTGWKSFGDESSFDQASFELAVLEKFLEGCDRSGLNIPGYNGMMRLDLDSPVGIKKLIADQPAAWPTPSFYEVLAAAQHYGVATRLLDWSRRSYVAAYFAASSAPHEYVNPNQQLAIWALNISNCQNWKRLRVVETPGGTSQNQAAQSGLFTLNQSDLDEADFRRAGLEESPDVLSTATRPIRGGAALIQMTLPIFEASELLILCEKFGVSGPTLFPGYQGVARGVSDWIRTQSYIETDPRYREEWDES